MNAALSVAGACLGLIAGSFLGTLAIRWPQGRSVAAGRSACDGCGAAIPWWRLVPIASFLAQRGRCAGCGGRIDWRHPAMEGGCALIGGIALAIAPGAAGVAGALFGWGLAVLALLDRDHFWLPDRIVLPLGGLGLGAGLIGIAPGPVDRVVGGAMGWAVLAAIGWAYRRTRGRIGLGAGDAKLLAAIGLWLGWRPLPWVVLGASALGLAWAVAARKRAADRLPLGTLLAASAWGGWVMLALASP